MAWLVRLLQWFGLAPRGGKVIDLESELSDGSFVVTSNTLEMDTTADIPGVHRQQFSHDTTAETLLSQHRTKLRELSRQGIQPLKHTTYAEIEAAQHRLQAIKSGYRATAGFVLPEDIDRTANERQQEAAEILKSALQDIRQTVA